MHKNDEQSQLEGLLTIVRSTLDELESSSHAQIGKHLIDALVSTETVLIKEIAKACPTRKESDNGVD